MPRIDAAAGAVDLRAFLAQRLRPLALILGVTVTVSAPVAFYVFGIRASRTEAAGVARRLADTIRHDAEERPRLWKYDTPKLLQHVRSHEAQAGVERIDVVDRAGVPIEPVLPEDRRRLRRASLLWADAPIETSGGEVGRVWVAASTTQVLQGALLLGLPFLLLAGALAGLVYWLPLRAMGRAEDRIGSLIRRLRESQAALSELAEGLEEQVEARSSELATAYEELRDKERRLRELSTRSVNLQEAERRAIARELHDSAGQALTAIRIHLQVLAERGESEHVAATARRAIEMVDGTLEEIRRAVRILGPAVLDDIGLEAALGRLCEDMSEGAAHAVELDVGLPPGPLPAAVESTVYRVVQEALTNVARHAGARQANVRVVGEAGGLLVEIRDDGRGMAPEASGRSRGIVGMRERAELVGGQLTVTAGAEQGTVVRAQLPLDPGQSLPGGVLGSDP